MEKPKPLKKIDVSYNEQNNFLSVKLKNDSLPRVAQAITDVSKKNIILAPDIKEQKVSAYILNRPIDEVLEMMAKSNSMLLTKDEHDNYYLEKDVTPVQNNKPTVQTARNRRSTSRQNNAPTGDSGNYEIIINDQGFLNIKAFEADANDMIKEAAEKLKINFFMYNTPEGVNTTLIANGITLIIYWIIFLKEKITPIRKQTICI